MSIPRPFILTRFLEESWLTLYSRATVPIFDPEKEKKLRRKIDRFIVPPVALLYLFCFIDRANIGQ